MSRLNKLQLQRRRRRKFFWLFVAAAVSGLLFAEQVAVLLVVSTLALCGLLIVVAFSNLEAREAEMQAVPIKEVDSESRTNSRVFSREARAA